MLLFMFFQKSNDIPVRLKYAIMENFVPEALATRV
jgi:hypothetical protein